MKPIKMLILGWYGTETVGDKAILGQIITECKNQYPKSRIFVASLYPFVTKKTLSELQLSAQVIPTYSLKFFHACASSDKVIMGGGPLMDLNVLSIPLLGFNLAKIFRKQTIIWGCGIGPLNKERYQKAVKRILELSDEIRVRDKASQKIAKQLTSRNDIKLINDPAKDYLLIKYNTSKVSSIGKKDILSCYLREWPFEYAGNISREEYISKKCIFEENLAKLISYISKKYELIPSFQPMHSFHVGNDDRQFYRYFIDKYFKGQETIYEKKPTTIDSIVHSMLEAKYSICMRFHSVLFAHTLKQKFLAIDYSLEGKIKNYLDDNNSLNQLLSIDDIISYNIEFLSEHIKL